MSHRRTDLLDKLTAWPIDVLYNASDQQPIGLLIPRIDGHKDIHHLYGPKSRRSEFSRADWRFLIRAACNTARAFAAVHESGCAIGDVNQGGVLVAQDATVRLIDCDSFQVIANDRKFLCEVGVETFTPPELQGKSFGGLGRTSNHDNFGLAVLVFLLLFMGRHPSAGRFHGSGETPIPKAIEQNRFPYTELVTDRSMERPPGTPPLSIVGSSVASLFEQAFSKEKKIGQRPTARDWILALGNLEKDLRQCSNLLSHWYQRSLSLCPWCQMEAATGVALFPLVLPATSGSHFSIDAIWRQIESIPHPGIAPAINAVIPKPTDEALSMRSARFDANVAAAIAALFPAGFAFSGAAKNWSVFLFVAAVATFFVVRNMLDKSDRKREFDARYTRAEGEWKRADGEWAKRAGAFEFDTKKSHAKDLREQYLKLPAIRATKIGNLKQRQRNSQLEHFLDKFEIEHAKIEGIGPGRKQTLESYGIETAADVIMSRVKNVPGFGPKLQKTLASWRRSIEARFVFDPSKGIDPRDVAKVEQEIQTEGRKIEMQLVHVIAELKNIHSQILNVRKNMYSSVLKCRSDFEQARIDLQAVNR